MYTDYVLEFWIDDKPHFGGDFYAHRNAPLVLHLDPGDHKLDVRLIRDVRAFGANDEPTIELELRCERSKSHLTLDADKMLVADIVDGVLASSFASVPVRNEFQTWIDVRSIQSIKVASHELVSYELAHLTVRDPHKITFMHQENAVSYAILRPPSERASKMRKDEVWPIMIYLHGAGVEADSEQVRTMFDSVPDLRCWLLSPSGMTSWSGDDWHTWGFADVDAAIAVVPAWIERVKWRGPSVDINKWLVVGHSNGGYVPYEWWTEADPRISYILRSATASYRHELLLDNASGIPLLEQHGGADDNVPVFHSRRMRQILSPRDPSSTTPRYVELAGRGHWFQDIMATPQLQRFYQQVLNESSAKEAPPPYFGIVVANPADMGSKNGVIIEQKQQPDQLGRVNIRTEVGTDHEIGTWEVETSNIVRFRIDKAGLGDNAPSYVIVDSDKGSYDQGWRSLAQRHGAQLGSIEAILRGRGPLTIRMSQTAAFDIALQTARNLYQYFRADAEIRGPDADVSDCEGNVIRIAYGRELEPSALSVFPIQIDPGRGLCIRDSSGRQHIYKFRAGLGVAMLRPLVGARLELVLWGYDLEGLRYAARLIPMQTGVGQPDFVVVSQQCAWKGAAGVAAMGFLDSSWQVSGASYLT
ncbi:MAG: hypothetical protein Q9191_000845 [Dirinaria sp. TL-2023a]